MEDLVIKFAKVKESAIIPQKKDEDAGYDIYPCWENEEKDARILSPHETRLIPTGIACALPMEYYFQVEERGSTGSKGIKKSAGVVDSGYRGEIFIAITNSTNRNVIFGDRDEYMSAVMEELAIWRLADPENLTEEQYSSMEEYLQNSIVGFEEVDDETKKEFIKKMYKDMQDDNQIAIFLREIDNAIYYPDNKAIAQLVLHKVPKARVEEISYEELKQIPSERQLGILGSSGK